MRPNNKKAGSGQATGKNGHLLGVNGHSQQQYNHTARNGKTFDVDQHVKAINRMMGDAYVMLSGWPACIRYSYFVGPDGKLITRGERRAGA
jgi:hypothetical protein